MCGAYEQFRCYFEQVGNKIKIEKVLQESNRMPKRDYNSRKRWLYLTVSLTQSFYIG